LHGANIRQGNEATRQKGRFTYVPGCPNASFPCYLFELTNAGKIFFTIFTALKKTNHLFFRLHQCFAENGKRKQVNRPGCYSASGRNGEEQIFFK